MDNEIINYAVFFILLILIIYLGCVNRNILDKLFGFKEKFNNKGFDIETPKNTYINRNKYDELEGTHYKIDTPLVSRIIKEPEGGWKNLYKNNYLKGNVDYSNGFDGVVTRNYLDNMNFFVN